MTIGEPAGIGPDLTLAVWRRRVELDVPAFYLIGDADFLGSRARALGLDLKLLGVQLLAHFALERRVGLALLLVAQREHLQTLRRHLWRGQVADFHVAEQLAQLRRKIARAARDRLAHRDDAQRAR
ncbi:MAG TPA: hypothetical protein VII39_10150 [Bradyrhizobium sp.]